jgi:hypothetical protein
MHETLGINTRMNARMQAICYMHAHIMIWNPEDSTMPATLRLNEKEEESLRKKCIELNKKLIAMEKSPIRESDLAHFILLKSISYVRVDKEGSLYIEE